MPVPGNKHHVGKAALHAALRRVGNADRLGVHANKEHVRFPAGRLDGEGALAAAKVQPHLAEGGGSGGRAGAGPMPPPVVGVGLDDVPVALQALFQDKVLGKACVHAVHGAPFLACGWLGGSSRRSWSRVEPKEGRSSSTKSATSGSSVAAASTAARQVSSALANSAFPLRLSSTHLMRAEILSAALTRRRRYASSPSTAAPLSPCPSPAKKYVP